MEKYVQLYFFFEVLNVSLDTAVSCIEGESGGRPSKQLRAETRVTGCPVFEVYLSPSKKIGMKAR